MQSADRFPRTRQLMCMLPSYPKYSLSLYVVYFQFFDFQWIFISSFCFEYFFLFLYLPLSVYRYFTLFYRFFRVFLSICRDFSAGFDPQLTWKNTLRRRKMYKYRKENHCNYFKAKYIRFGKSKCAHTHCEHYLSLSFSFDPGTSYCSVYTGTK